MKEARLTRPNNIGIALHRYLAYPMKSVSPAHATPPIAIWGKQVRDNSDSSGLVLAFTSFCRTTRPCEVYNGCLV